jgi:hypothetical protein
VAGVQAVGLCGDEGHLRVQHGASGGAAGVGMASDFTVDGAKLTAARLEAGFPNVVEGSCFRMRLTD